MMKFIFSLMIAFYSTSALAMGVMDSGTGNGASEREACMNAQADAKKNAARICSQNRMQSIAESASACTCSSRPAIGSREWDCHANATANCQSVSVGNTYNSSNSSRRGITRP